MEGWRWLQGTADSQRALKVLQLVYASHRALLPLIGSNLLKPRSVYPWDTDEHAGKTTWRRWT